YIGTYYTNLMGVNDKWIYSAGGQWYCLLPGGELRRWAGSWPATLESAALVATLGDSYYTDPSLLWNAQPAFSPATLPIHNGELRRWAGTWSATEESAALVANVGASVYANPSLLWNAQPVLSPATLTVKNGVLVITAKLSFRGSFVVKVTVSNGTQTTTEM